MTIYAQKAAGTSKNAYNIAFRDWRRPPVIRRLNLDPEGQVRVSARDDVMVTRVTVTVLDEAGQPLEQGGVELWMGIWWDYRAVHHGRIQVEAWDLGEVSSSTRRWETGEGSSLRIQSHFGCESVLR